MLCMQTNTIFCCSKTFEGILAHDDVAAPDDEIRLKQQKPQSQQHNNIVFKSEEQNGATSKIQLMRIDAICDCVDMLLAFVANQFANLSISAVDDISKVRLRGP